MEIQRKTPFIARQNLGELLDNAFKMIGRTWTTSLLLAAVLLLPLSLLSGWAAERFLAASADLPSSAGNPARDMGALYLRFLLGFSAGMLLWRFASLFVFTSVSVHAAAVASGRKPGFSEAIRTAGARFYGRCILQSLVRTALTIGILAGTVLLAAAPLAILFTGRSPAAALALLAAVLLLGAALSIWLSILLRFAPQAIVFDGEPVFGGLQHSAKLVRGAWWRLFGACLAVSILFGFAVGLISFPVTAAVMLPLVSRLAGMALRGSFEASQATGFLRRGAGWIAAAVGSGLFIRSAAEGLFMPAFFGQFYIDLKVRKGELPEPRRRSGSRANAR